jgi:hypothetical protein
MKTVSFVGNFGVDFSTESHMAATWEQYLGWRVIRLQENQVTEQQVLDACKESQLLQITHTHSWSCPVTLQTLEKVRAMGVKSFGFHLDKYFGIGSREASYFDHASFHVDRFFSTDGNHEDGWREKNINHHWLLAGVYEGEANFGHASDTRIPVLFSGSEGYHDEYKWRPRMVAALRSNYGENFKIVNGIRGQALNDLYASSTVCVGDHIFAGEPRYSSDRLFETCGRGGFLVYPKTEGVTDQIPGLYCYEPQNIDSLFHAIDYFLDKAHESERIERRDAAHKWVRENATYTHRLREILRIMEL